MRKSTENEMKNLHSIQWIQIPEIYKGKKIGEVVTDRDIFYTSAEGLVLGNKGRVSLHP